jgi:hypothetical protein
MECSRRGQPTLLAAAGHVAGQLGTARVVGAYLLGAGTASESLEGEETLGVAGQ